MAWFRKNKQPLRSQNRRDMPSDVFDKCEGCGEILYGEKLVQNLQVCPSCGHHFRVTADRYVEILLDEGSFDEMDREMRSRDPLDFRDLKPYRDRLKTAEADVGRREAVLVGTGMLEGFAVVLAVMDFRFVGGSMGSVVGEKIARAARAALKRKEPLIVVSASGGARMQEGIYSLMQMAKVSSLLGRLHEAALPYIAVITDPTTGGVTASYAMLGDVNLAEPGALIGFAGPRVIGETIRQKLPEGFQTSEYLLEHGMVDMVVHRHDLPVTIARLISMLMKKPPIVTAETEIAGVEQLPAPANSGEPVPAPATN